MKPTAKEVRRWAQARPGGHLVPNKGYLPIFVVRAWNKAHPDRPYEPTIDRWNQPKWYQ